MRMNAYIGYVTDLEPPLTSRWELYRVLSEPMRLRLLALTAEEELSIGELAELLNESQPNVSRHATALRQARLLADRREGTRTFLRVTSQALRDTVVLDALASGRALCDSEGSLARIAEVLRAREAPTHEYFARPGKSRVDAFPAETGAYLAAVSPLLLGRELAVDAGTGDGPFLDVLAPLFRRVIGVDRAAAQLARARERVDARGYTNVTLLQVDVDSPVLRRAVGVEDVGGGADAVFASRLLHHAPQPGRLVAELAALCAPSGALVLLDYAHHEDESMLEQADAWLGFDAEELRRFARKAQLEDAHVLRIPASLCGDGADHHLPWQVLVARKRSDHVHKSRNNRRRRNEDG
jgi:ArsR family transcriptional regulator